MYPSPPAVHAPPHAYTNFKPTIPVAGAVWPSIASALSAIDRSSLHWLMHIERSPLPTATHCHMLTIDVPITSPPISAVTPHLCAGKQPQNYQKAKVDVHPCVLVFGIQQQQQVHTVATGPNKYEHPFQKHYGQVPPTPTAAQATSTRMSTGTLSDIPSGRPIFVHLHQTQSGVVFSPYATVEAVKSTFSPGLHELLKASIAAEDDPNLHNNDPGVEGDEDMAPCEGNAGLKMEQDYNNAHAAPTPSSSHTAEHPMHGPDPVIALEGGPHAAGGLAQPSKQSCGNRQRKRKREADIIENGYHPSPKICKRHIHVATLVETSLNVQDLLATSCGYAATNHTAPAPALPAAIQALVDQGYEVIKNDGKTTKIFVGPDGHAFAIAADQPCDPTYKEDHNEEYTDKLFKKMPHLRRIFGKKSVFPATAFNFGPRVCTESHRDQLNLAFGWCSIQALGWFDPELGRHLVLDDIKKIIEFPAGSLILIPSATLTHRNLPVRDHEV
ncbi:hypothetical protein HYPSUDRAFT_208543 [Hypholoma sublateritium FD-334 SS-4]|uniref:Uncharacterized protein n=1 Tax=Hypholoma sublateritium (strain FD-334 SS-4) TaxID=945553 RepID=A0A0D2KJ03_HYPSF|nr:hypothetical protein HYPSUDRAFT_208543 [Hypholoma sublateritium FD-334 SS-4]